MGVVQVHFRAWVERKGFLLFAKYQTFLCVGGASMHHFIRRTRWGRDTILDVLIFDGAVLFPLSLMIIFG